MKQWRIRTVKVFWLAIPHDTTTKGHHAAPTIKYRKHHPATEPVIALSPAIFGFDQKSGFDHQLFVDFFALECGLQRTTIIGRKSQTEIGNGFVIQTASAEILQPFFAFGHAQHALKEHTGDFHHLIQGFGFLFAFLGFAGWFWHIHADLIGQHLNRLDKGQTTGIHHKADDVAMRTTAKAVIETFLVVDRKGGRFFRMERTQPGILPATLDQLHRRSDDIRQIDPCPQVVQKRLGKAHDCPDPVILVRSSAQMVITLPRTVFYCCINDRPETTKAGRFYTPGFHLNRLLGVNPEVF